MDKVLTAHREHPRLFEDFRFVYPVLSRRSGGISIGMNVNPDKRCNFDCLYCQVDRTAESAVKRFDLAAAEQELRQLLDIVQSGKLARYPAFTGVPAELLRLRDVALSGDGEPTTLPNFADTIAMVARLKPRGVKLILITNAGSLNRAEVQRGLTIMDAHEGEVWAKLDAGTEEYFRFIERAAVPFARILQNITQCAQARPIVIQSLFMKVYGHGPAAEEIAAYAARLQEIMSAGGRIKSVQICTIARKPMTVINGRLAWEAVTPLSNAEVDAIAHSVHHRTGLTAESYYGLPTDATLSTAAKVQGPQASASPH